MKNATMEFALLANATSIAWTEVPEWPAVEFVRATATELDRGGRLCAWFGMPEGGATRLVAVVAFDADNTLAVGRSLPVSGSYPALTVTHPQAHLFEREVWEQHGLTPDDHPWLIAGIRHAHVREFQAQAIATVAAIADRLGALPLLPKRGRRETYAVLGHQAKLQVAARSLSPPPFDAATRPILNLKRRRYLACGARGSASRVMPAALRANRTEKA